MLGAFRATDIEIAHGATSPALAGARRRDSRRRGSAASPGVTIADLMPARASTEPLPGVPDEPEQLRTPMPPRPPAVRLPAVAGAFYPDDPATVAADALRLAAPLPEAPPRPAIAAVCPHAGWMYSGALAGRLAAAVEVPTRVLVLAPNHTGRGARGSVWPGGAWRFPGADVPVDAAFCRALCEASTLLEPDAEAHTDEHAIEVLVPLLRGAPARAAPRPRRARRPLVRRVRDAGRRHRADDPGRGRARRSSSRPPT